MNEEGGASMGRGFGFGGCGGGGGGWWVIIIIIIILLLFIPFWGEEECSI